jgi:hypothetical protein
MRGPIPALSLCRQVPLCRFAYAPTVPAPWICRALAFLDFKPVRPGHSDTLRPPRAFLAAIASVAIFPAIAVTLGRWLGAVYDSRLCEIPIEVRGHIDFDVGEKARSHSRIFANAFIPAGVCAHRSRALDFLRIFTRLKNRTSRLSVRLGGILGNALGR